MIKTNLEINLDGTLAIKNLIAQLQEGLDAGITHVELGHKKSYGDGGRGGGAENYVKGGPILVQTKAPKKVTTKKLFKNLSNIDENNNYMNADGNEVSTRTFKKPKKTYSDR